MHLNVFVGATELGAGGQDRNLLDCLTLGFIC
jgi:hypothetical protein